MNICTTNKCIHIRLYHFEKTYSIFMVISVSVRGYGLKPVKRGCVVHCVTSKNNQKSQKGNFTKLEKIGPLTSFSTDPGKRDIIQWILLF